MAKFYTMRFQTLWAVRSFMLATAFLLAACSASHSALNAGDPEDRRQAIKETNDPEVLRKVLENDKDILTRCAALEKITDAETIARAIRKDKAWRVRVLAVGKLDDQALLAEVAVNDEKDVTRKAAIERLTDQQRIAYVANRSRDINVIFTAIAKLNDTRLVSTITENQDTFPGARKKARERLAVLSANIDDIESLVLLAMQKEEKAATQALHRIKKMEPVDNATLVRLSDAPCHSVSAYGQMTLRDRLPTVNDQEILASAARSDWHVSVRVAALKRLHDNKLLEKIAMNQEEKEPVRVAAIESLKDQVVLTRIAKDDDDTSIRAAAAGRITDKKTLLSLASKESELSVRMGALTAINDPVQLSRLAQSDSSVEVRASATSKLKDQSLLKKIARKDKDASVRIAAVARLNDDKLIAQLARRDRDPSVRKACIERISDKDVLGEIAWKERVDEVREAAVKKVDDYKLLIRVVAERGRFRDTVPPMRFSHKSWSAAGHALSMRIYSTKDRDFLLYVIARADEDTAKIALTRLGELDMASPEYLYKLATSNKYLRAETALNILNEADRDIIELLSKIARNALFKELTGAADEFAVDRVKRTTDLGRLSTIAKNRRLRTLTRIPAIERIEDIGILKNIAKGSSSRHLRNTAKMRLITLEPALISHYGKMTIEYDVNNFGEDYQRGKSKWSERVEIQQEVVSIEVRDSKGKRAAYEVFSAELKKVEYGSLHKMASVDVKRVYFDLLRDLPKAILDELSKNARLSDVRKMARQLIARPPH